VKHRSLAIEEWEYNHNLTNTTN